MYWMEAESYRPTLQMEAEMILRELAFLRCMRQRMF